MRGETSVCHAEQFLYVEMSALGKNCGTEIDPVPTTGQLNTSNFSQMKLNKQACSFNGYSAGS